MVATRQSYKIWRIETTKMDDFWKVFQFRTFENRFENYGNFSVLSRWFNKNQSATQKEYMSGENLLKEEV